MNAWFVTQDRRHPSSKPTLVSVAAQQRTDELVSSNINKNEF